MGSGGDTLGRTWGGVAQTELRASATLMILNLIVSSPALPGFNLNGSIVVSLAG
jgi:hypothetical protein